MKLYIDEKDSALGGLRQVKRTTPKGYRYLPLDIPKFKYKHKVLTTFKNNTVWDSTPHPITNQVTQYHNEDSQKYDPWIYEVLTEPHDFDAFDINIPRPFTKKAKEKYPELIQFLMMNLPFEHFFYVKLVMPHRDIFPHIDNNYLHYQVPVNFGRNWHLQTKEFSDYMLDNEPSGYHIHINGSKTTSLYVAEAFESREKSRENRDWSHVERDYCQIPETTDTYAMMYTDSPHGVSSINNSSNKDRLSVFILGKVIQENHKKLIEKSKERYINFLKIR
tara:strand:+ start:2112 stop:2942 length:831 start_codon:yes stop_codon:yes gene_type:complete